MSNTPVILAIDTSLAACSVALLKGREIAAEAVEPTPGLQSKMLIPMIEATLAKAEVNYAQLIAVACNLGPGSFTGIRVGLATARAIALAAEKPLIGVSSLEAIAWGAGLQGDILAVVDAHRGQLYVQRFRRNGGLIPQSAALLVDAKMLGPLGHGAKIVQAHSQARYIAVVAADKWDSGAHDFATAPLYIREPDAKQPAIPGLKCEGELL